MAIFSIFFVAIILTSILIVFSELNRRQKFRFNISKIMKIIVIIYFTFVFVGIVLPDAYIISTNSIEEIKATNNTWQTILRWGNSISWIILPLAVFTDKRVFKNIAIYFCLPITILSVCFYQDFMGYFLDPSGRGLNNIPSLSENFKKILFNEWFRGIWIGIEWSLAIAIPLSFIFIDKHFFRVKEKMEWINFLVVLPLIALSMIPIYLPQRIIGFTDIKLYTFGPLHLLWILIIVLQIVGIYFVFRNKSKEDKYIVCVLLAMVVLCQYNSMFALTINIKRLPIQLCNLGSYFILIALLTRNRHLFNFNYIVNVVGATLAILVPDVDSKGFANVWTMHFILEHTNILVVPIITVLLGVFDPIDRRALKDYAIGFTIYFVFCAVVGSSLNAIAAKTGNNAYSANYLFMFDKEVILKLIPAFEPLTRWELTFGYYKIMPIFMLFVYFGYNSLCLLFYGSIQLVRKIREKRAKNKDQDQDDNDMRVDRPAFES